MGQCYWINLEIKIKNEKDFIDKTNQFFNDKSQFSEPAEMGFTNVEQIMLHMFAEPSYRHLEEFSYENNKIVCNNGFDASYGWCDVMTNWFIYLQSILEDGSKIYIYPDTGVIHYEIVNGALVEGQDIQIDTDYPDFEDFEKFYSNKEEGLKGFTKQYNELREKNPELPELEIESLDELTDWFDENLNPDCEYFLNIN
jgi:hypothetical protein